MFRIRCSMVLSLTLFCMMSATVMASNWQMVVGPTYTNGVHSLYSTNFRDVNQLTIDVGGNYTITATTDNFVNPPPRNIRPGTKRVMSFNCHFKSIAVKAMDGTVIAIANFPTRTDGENQTEVLKVNLPPGVYYVDTTGIVNGRASSPLGHYGRFTLTTKAD